MRLGVTIFIIFLVFGAIWFAFFYYFDIPQPELSVNDDSAANAFILPIAETSYSPVRDFTVADPVLDAGAAALYDVKSGRFLYSQDIKKRLPIASITKLMTAVVIADNLKLNEIYTIPIEAVNVDGLGADLYKSERLRAGDLFKIMLIKSSNDAAVMFSIEAQKHGIDLVAKMNEKAQELGMYNTHFSDPAGLDDQGAFSTAGDLVKLVRYASGYDLIADAVIVPAADINSVDGLRHHVVNTNQLLGRLPGIVLGKTGFTDVARGTMAAEVALDGGNEQVISIILGSEDRFGETKKLMEWGQKAYSWK